MSMARKTNPYGEGEGEQQQQSKRKAKRHAKTQRAVLVYNAYCTLKLKTHHIRCSMTSTRSDDLIWSNEHDSAINA